MQVNHRLIRLAVGSLSILMAFSLPIAAQNWPSFRGRHASGVADGKRTPIRWDVRTPVNIQWRVPIPGLGHSSAVIWDNKLFLTTAVSVPNRMESEVYEMGDMTSSPDSGLRAWLVLCLDKRSGKQLWTRKAYQGIPKSRRHPLNSFATPTPAVDDAHVVAYFGSEGLYCYDLNGKLLWKQDLGTLNTGHYQDSHYQWAIASSPIIYKDIVIVQCDVYDDAFIAAYNIDDGRLRWRVKRDDKPSWSTPTIYESGDHAELITCAPDFVRSYDPLTGKELWKLNWRMDIHTSTAIFSDELIYASSGKGPTNPLFAIRPGARGDISLPLEQSSSEHIAWVNRKAGAITTSPLLYRNYVYTLTDNGVLRCFEARNGALQYEQRVSATVFFASPVAADGKLYLTSTDGDIYVVKAGPKYELLASNDVGASCMATPAISEGRIYIRTLHNLYCVGPESTRN